MCLLYIGGILGVGRHDFKDDEVKFKNLGFDRVYPPEADLKGAISDLRSDLKARGVALTTGREEKKLPRMLNGCRALDLTDEKGFSLRQDARRLRCRRH